MKNPPESFVDFITTVFDKEMETSTSNKVKVASITFQVTEACSLSCTYCYQINKHSKNMSFDTAKKFIDDLFDNRKDINAYINETSIKGLIIEFIGGEPLLNIDLISQITQYWEQKFSTAIDCPWSKFHVYSIGTNGVAYFDTKVQDYIHKYKSILNVSVTVDGYKELHDKCRVFPNGDPSYYLAEKAALDGLKNYGYDSTKLTIVPDNIPYLTKGVINLIDLGFTNIHLNCAFEDIWHINDAKELYKQLKNLADYIVTNEVEDKVYIALFDAEKYMPITDEMHKKSWCGSNSNMLALNPDGQIFPCIRFMETSLKDTQPPFEIGDINSGINKTEKHKNSVNILKDSSTDSISPQQCLDCPIMSGCSWCNAYNYQCYGTINHKTLFICDCHKAAALGALYLAKISHNQESCENIAITKEIALDIIDETEWNYLSSL